MTIGLKHEKRIAQFVSQLGKWTRTLKETGVGLESLQCELALVYLALNHTWEQDGWGNWSIIDDESLEILQRFLALDSKLVSAIKKGANSGVFQDKPMSKIGNILLGSLLKNRKSLTLPSQDYIWLDIRFDRVVLSSEPLPKIPES